MAGRCDPGVMGTLLFCRFATIRETVDRCLDVSMSMRHRQRPCGHGWERSLSASGAWPMSGRNLTRYSDCACFAQPGGKTRKRSCCAHACLRGRREKRLRRDVWAAVFSLLRLALLSAQLQQRDSIKKKRKKKGGKQCRDRYVYGRP